MWLTSATSDVVVQVLGPTAVRVGARRHTDLSHMQRVVLARLALGGTVSQVALADTAWPDGAPATARAALQNQVSRLRAVAGPGAIATVGGGYRLRAPTDAGHLRELTGEAERLLASHAYESALATAETALALVKGEPFVDIAHLDVADPARRAAFTSIRVVEDVRVAAALGLGRTGWAVQEAELLFGREPLDEHRAALLARSLAAAGRRGDALAAISRCGEALRSELGIDPGPDLVGLERSILDPGPRPASGPRLHFVGRVVERDAVVAAVEAGTSVEVCGERGIGLTRFLRRVHEALRARPGHTVMIAGRSHASAPAAELSEILEQLDLPRERSLGVVGSFLPALASVGEPVTVVVDDAHLVGPSSRSMLHRAAELPGVTLVAGEHGHGSTPAGYRQVRLDGLRERDVADLLGQRLPAHPTPDPYVVGRLARESGGNPQLLELLLSDEAVLDWATEPRDVAEPPVDAVSGVVLERTRAAGSAGRTALEVLALVGSEVPVSTLTPLLATGGVDALLREDLVDVLADRAVFRHEAVRRSVLTALSQGRAAELHHAVAEVIDGTSAAVSAAHRRHAAALDPAAAVSALRRAAEEAHRVGAHPDAVRWCSEALDVIAEHAAAFPADGSESVAGRVALGDAMRLAGDPAHVDVLLEAAAAATAGDLHDELDDAAYALLQLGGTTSSGRLHPGAEAVAERALARVGDPERTAVVSAAASLAWSMTGDANRSRELFLRGEQMATTSWARRSVLPFAYLALGHPRDLDRREACASELERLARESDDPVALHEALHLQFSNALVRPDAAVLAASFAEMRRSIDRVGDVGRRWELVYQQATLAHLRGDLDEAGRLAQRGLELFGPVSATRAFAVYASQVLAIRWTQGRLLELVPVLEQLVADQPGVPAWHAALALAVADQDPDTASREATAALEATEEDFTWLAAHVVGGRAAALAGASTEVVDEYRSRLAPWTGLGCWQGSCSLGPVDTTLALLGRAAGDDAATAVHTERARRTARDLASPVHERDLDDLGLPS